MLLGILTGFIATSLGWQINLLAVQRGLLRGRLAAFLVSCGAILADLVFLFIGLTGIAPILTHPEWWQIIRWVGIVTLLSIAFRTLWTHERPRKEVVEEVVKRNPTKNFLMGFLVVITNPAIFLLWVGVVSFFFSHFPQFQQPWFKEFFLFGFLIGGCLWAFPLAFVLLNRLKKWAENNEQFTARLSAALLILVAVFLIFEKFKFS